jgi:hypothetical protein
MTGGPWPEDGPIEILDPADANDELAGVDWDAMWKVDQLG